MIKPRDFLSRIFKRRQSGEVARRSEPLQAAAVRVGIGCNCGNAHVVMIDDAGNRIAAGLITREQMPSFVAALCEAVGAKFDAHLIEDEPDEPGEAPRAFH